LACCCPEIASFIRLEHPAEELAANLSHTGLDAHCDLRGRLLRILQVVLKVPAYFLLFTGSEPELEVAYRDLASAIAFDGNFNPIPVFALGRLGEA
jgi:hypothetical protein